ncbi:hypothetical protein CEXT_526911 [Caerostris extrusa]|uniref:Uncharacterized protein n=1 Tax=Caerostris extrusa TaxID=172846 RepID=A0AAV4VBM0_CAEEX|nr:hypothetical protein CEXT_526911 [Caerostris extrusa]
MGQSSIAVARPAWVHAVRAGFFWSLGWGCCGSANHQLRNVLILAAKHHRLSGRKDCTAGRQNHRTRKVPKINIPEKPATYATMAKNMAKSGKPQDRQRSRSRPNITKKFVTTIKPMDITPDNTSLKTKRTVQAKIDVKKINVAIKSVKPIKNGGIIVETISPEEDLDKLIYEFKAKDELTKEYQIGKPGTSTLFALTCLQTQKKKFSRKA